MGQTFQLVAPRAKLALCWSGKLGEILFDSADDIVRILVVPVRPQRSYSPNPPVSSTNTVDGEKREAKRSRDDNDVYDESSRRHKRIKGYGLDDTIVSNAVTTLSSLPLELHHLIFSFIDDIVDTISFGITNQYFLSIGQQYLDDYLISHLPQWAGTNIVCVGEDVKPNDYPPGLFSTEELEVLRQKTFDMADVWDYPEQEDVRYKPFDLSHFGYPSVSMIEEDGRHLWRIHLSLIEWCDQRGISKDPGYRHIKRQFMFKNETYFPTDQQWILRNLTTKQIVRSDAIALSPDYIRGPEIRFLGFGEVVMSRICWSTSPSVSMTDTTNISRGVWAGHCFDITTLSRHEAETREEEWRDVSDEVVGEIASIWEGEFGADWRKIICES
ncbi:hypothetical protein NUW58_g999 [Xylaria curta]|uniref:Uncharacterized protein n=1 Tax=Xylaria curta TaxID=42375 RepID=A0ACC1PM19_9PEZI|nr:hypothetical protein NUW58_g999 [Xylaria curta]